MPIMSLYPPPCSSARVLPYPQPKSSIRVLGSAYRTSHAVLSGWEKCFSPATESQYRICLELMHEGSMGRKSTTTNSTQNPFRRVNERLLRFYATDLNIEANVCRGNAQLRIVEFPSDSSPLILDRDSTFLKTGRRSNRFAPRSCSDAPSCTTSWIN